MTSASCKFYLSLAAKHNVPEIYIPLKNNVKIFSLKFKNSAESISFWLSYAITLLCVETKFWIFCCKN